MSVTMEMWEFVVKAFLEWKRFEINEFGPQTVYLSPSEIKKLSATDFRAWCENYRNKYLAERVHQCEKLSIAFEDLRGTLKQEESIVIVDGLIRLCDEVKRLIGIEIDSVSDCMVEIKNHTETFDPIRRVGEVEEEIRKLMGNFKTGFDHMEELGFPPPEET